MKFTSGIYRRGDPRNLCPVVVEYTSMKHMGIPTTGFAYTVSVFTCRDVTGVPDSTTEIQTGDFQKTFIAPYSLFSAIDARLQGVGNVMAAIRNHCKAQITAHNTAVNPGGQAAVHVDLDDDNP